MRASLTVVSLGLASALLVGCSGAPDAKVPQVTLTSEQQQKYDSSCKFCHEAAGSGAIMKGDTKAWGVVLQRPIDDVLQGVINGVNGMPPLGQCFDCSKEDLKALVYFLAQEKQ